MLRGQRSTYQSQVTQWLRPVHGACYLAERQATVAISQHRHRTHKTQNGQRQDTGHLQVHGQCFSFTLKPVWFNLLV